MPAQSDLSRPGVHPERVRAALDPRLDDTTIARLLACDRLRRHLDARLGLDELDTSNGEATAHAWLLDDPAEAARRAGALMHGQALRAVLSGPEVASLVAAIGRDAHALGLREGALSPPQDHGGDLVGAITRDGHACLGEWLNSQSAGLRKCVLLALPPGTPVEVSEATSLGEQVETIMALVMRSYQPAPAAGAHG